LVGTHSREKAKGRKKGMIFVQVPVLFKYKTILFEKFESYFDIFFAA